MKKLPNKVTNVTLCRALDKTELNYDTIEGNLFSISRYWSTKTLGGRGIEDIIQKEYDLQRIAVNTGMIKPGAELHPDETRDVLMDEAEKSYTMMALTVPSRKNDYDVIAMVRPDVAKLPSGEKCIKLWYTPIVAPSMKDFKVQNPHYGYTSIEEFLLEHAVKSMLWHTGGDNMVLADDQGSMKAEDLRKYGFKALIDKVPVPHLAAKGSELYRKVHEATLMVRPEGYILQVKPKVYNLRVPLADAIAMTQSYQNEGFGVPYTARIMKDTVKRLEQKAAGTGFVQLT